MGIWYLATGGRDSRREEVRGRRKEQKWTAEKMIENGRVREKSKDRWMEIGRNFSEPTI